MTTNHAVVLRHIPQGEPKEGDFAIESLPMPQPAAGEVLLRTIYLTVDPYMRGRIGTSDLIPGRIAPGEVILGETVCEVVESRDPAIKPGTIVLSDLGWRTYGTRKASTLRTLDPQEAPISTAVGVLGVPGFTAWVGIECIAHPQPGETVVVAAAAGPVGSLVGQLAKRSGARAVGIAGGTRKADWLRSIGFDAVVDRHSPSFSDDLAAALPDGIDVYFENVGGAVFDAVLPHLNNFARVPVSGLVAHYNDDDAPASGPDRTAMIMRTLQMKRWMFHGFIQADYAAEHFDHFQKAVSAGIRDGSIAYAEDITEGLQSAPEAFIRMLRGASFGKALVRVSPEPTP